MLIIPGVAGPVAGFLGIPALARLLQTEAPVIPASLHNSLRAVCWMFFAVVPVVIWSLREMKERAVVFQLIVGCGWIAGFTRLTGVVVDGWPGRIPIGIMTIELGFMPLLLLWHRRLIASTAGGRLAA